MRFLVLSIVSGSSLITLTLFFICVIIYQFNERRNRQVCQCSNEESPPSYEEALSLPEFII